jgi:hypothetical protein
VRFGRSLARWRPDVVWALGQRRALLAAPVCRVRGVPIVWHKVDLSWDRQLAPALALAVDGVIAVSEGAARAIGPLRARVTAIVPPPIALDPVLEAALDGPPTIGTLARGGALQGPPSHPARGGPAVRRVPRPAGAGLVLPMPEYPGYRAELLALARELELEERVELPEWVPGASALARLTVFVNATYQDEQGFGFEG